MPFFALLASNLIFTITTADFLSFLLTFGHRNMNYLSFNYMNKNSKKILLLQNKGAIFISVAASYLASNKENEKTY
ncbi:hypothetical protein METH109765_22925 [Mesobacillus thioparans]